MDVSDISDTDICVTPAVPVVPPVVSVVIPAYNRETSVLTAIRSVQAQACRDIEILVVDDGSRDATVARVAALDDPRIGLLRHHRNQGPSGARNTGTRAASAPLVAFQDSDDIWLPDKLERQMACLDAPATVASYCGMIVTGRLGGTEAAVLRLVPSETYPAGDIGEALLERSFISTQTLVARRTALLQAGLFDPDLRALEDWDLALRLSSLGDIMPVAEALVVQRFSDNSLTAQTAAWAQAHQAILEKHAGLVKRFPKTGARQWGIVSGRFRKLGQPGPARLAARRAMQLSGPKPRQILQYLLAGQAPRRVRKAPS